MKVKVRIVAVLCCLLIIFSLVGCHLFNGGRYNFEALGSPNDVEALNYNEIIDEDFTAFKDKLEQFSALFASSAYGKESGGNVAISPVSVYMALAMTIECAGGETRQEILNGLGMTYEEVKGYTSMLYRQLNIENKRQNKKIGELSLSNTIWIDDELSYKEGTINNLANDYLCYSNSVDFNGDKDGANKAIRGFIKDKTNKLIDKDFDLSEETICAIVNTLYLKDVWNDVGKDLEYANGKYKFKNSNGKESDVSLLQSYYTIANVMEGEKYRTCYAVTESGYRIKFILPKDGYAVSEVFNSETILEVNAITDYKGYDEVNNVQYNTRVLFPAFKAGYDNDVKEVLKQYFNVNRMFDRDRAEFSNLVDDQKMSAWVEAVRHVTSLTVDKKGIEGAAVTVVQLPGATAPRPMTKVYQDFIIDKAFGFIVTDRYNTTIFSGVINNV